MMVMVVNGRSSMLGPKSAFAERLGWARDRSAGIPDMYGLVSLSWGPDVSAHVLVARNVQYGPWLMYAGVLKCRTIHKSRPKHTHRTMSDLITVSCLAPQLY